MIHENGIEAAGFAIDNYVQDYCYGDIGEKRFAEKVIKAYLDASGMVMVPREPTEEMRVAAITSPLPSIEDNRPLYEICWHRMLFRAPNPFQTPEESREKK